MLGRWRGATWHPQHDGYFTQDNLLDLAELFLGGQRMQPCQERACVGTVGIVGARMNGSELTPQNRWRESRKRPQSIRIQPNRNQQRFGRAECRIEQRQSIVFGQQAKPSVLVSIELRFRQLGRKTSSCRLPRTPRHALSGQPAVSSMVSQRV